MAWVLKVIILKTWQNKSTYIIIFYRFIQSAKNLASQASIREITSLFYEIAGFKATHISKKDINNWQNRNKNRLKGDRGYHFPLMI